MGNDYTADELRTLAAVRPELVGRLADGTLVPTMSRDELLAMDARYPSLKINTMRLSQTVNTERALAPDAATEASLRARFPSMFPAA